MDTLESQLMEANAFLNSKHFYLRTQNIRKTKTILSIKNQHCYHVRSIKKVYLRKKFPAKWAIEQYLKEFNLHPDEIRVAIFYAPKE